MSNDSRKEVRPRALSGLFEVLKLHGGACFDRDTWQMTFRGVLFPLFDDIQLESHSFSEKKQDTLCLAALSNYQRRKCPCFVHSDSTSSESGLRQVETFYWLRS